MLSEQIIASRRGLLDAAIALGDHLNSFVLVGAHAIYLYTGDDDVPVATTTRDSDMALIPGLLGPEPTLEKVMQDAGFNQEERHHKGEWVNSEGIPVDLLAPVGLQDERFRKKRGARIPPHADFVARNIEGLEGIVVDTQVKLIEAMEVTDQRSVRMKVAGPATLVVAKTFKICERLEDTADGRKDRTKDKDAYDLYRLLRSIELEEFISGFRRLSEDERTLSTTSRAVTYLQTHGDGPDSEICQMVGRAEGILGNPERAIDRAAFLIAELLAELNR